MRPYPKYPRTGLWASIKRKNANFVEAHGLQLKAKKKIEHYPQFGVLLDLDAYIEDPPYPDDLSISDFVTTAFEDFCRVKQTVLTAARKT